MADKLVPSTDDTGAIRRFRDMGDGTWAEVVSQAAGAAGAAGYPAGATPVTSASRVANAIATATLAAAPGKMTYLSGLQITGTGATAGGPIGIDVAGVVGAPMAFTLAVATGAGVANTPLIIQFNPPIPASALNTAISVAVPALGAGNASSSVALQGFQL